MIYLVRNSHNGLEITAMHRNKFDAWYKDKIEDIKPEFHPVFIDVLPDSNSDTNRYCIIDGGIIRPQAVTTVTYYKLPEKVV